MYIYIYTYIYRGRGSQRINVNNCFGVQVLTVQGAWMLWLGVSAVSFVPGIGVEWPAERGANIPKVCKVQVF